MGTCFVYGSLMAPEVVHALLLRIPQQKPAVLRNFRRHSLEGHTYPGAVPAEESCIHGAVLLGLHESEELTLDQFEASFSFAATGAPETVLTRAFPPKGRRVCKHAR